jgi:uncharacterized protein
VAFAAAYLLALDCIYELYQQTGRKLVVANFVNVILGCRCTDRATPHARHFVLRWRTLLLRCGHLRGSVPVQRVQGPGRVPGGNLFTGGLEGAFATDAFRAVTGHGAPQK